MDNNEKFSPAQIRYLISLYRLSEGESGVKNVELANALGLSKPSVHHMLKSLASLGVVRQEVFGLAFFTEQGRALAQKYHRCYRVIEKQLAQLFSDPSASEGAICALLAYLPCERLDALVKSEE